MSNTVRRVRVGGGLGKQLANSFDSAVRLLRGLSFHESTGPAAASGAPAGKAASAATANERLQRLRLARKQLAAQVAKLEQELDQLHGTITSGSRAPAGDTSGRSLNVLMENARQLRERLQERRLELARIERNIARERQLVGQAVEPSGEPPPSRTAAPPTAPSRARSPRAQLAQRAVASALREAPLDRAERVLVAGIAEGLLSDDEEVRRQAVTKIGERPKPVVSLLVLAANDSHERVRLTALGALSGQRHPAAAKVFRRFLRDPSPALRLAALRGLAGTDAPSLTKGDLVATLGDGDAAVRRAAADVLSWLGEDGKMSSEVIQALAFALYDEDEAVRVSAAEALGTGGGDRAVLALMRAIGDESESVRGAALDSLRLLVGAEVDSVAQQAPPEKRAEALKLWWRTARVQLRSGTPVSSSVEVGSAARDVLQTLASLKKETPTAAAASAVAPPPVAVQAARETRASQGQAAAKAATPVGDIAPSIGKPGAVPAEAPGALPADEGEFESVLPQGEGAGEQQEEESEEYENILDEDKGT